MRSARRHAAALFTAFALVACGGSSPTSSGAGAASPGTTIIVLHNATSGTITAYDDAGAKPLWLTIGSFRLDRYGGTWCDGAPHVDPFPVANVIEPGGTIEFAWDGSYVTSDGGCYRIVSAAPGAYPARACAFQGAPKSSYDPFDAKSDPGVPVLCSDFTIGVRAGADATFDVTLRAQ